MFAETNTVNTSMCFVDLAFSSPCVIGCCGSQCLSATFPITTCCSINAWHGRQEGATAWLDSWRLTRPCMVGASTKSCTCWPCNMARCSVAFVLEIATLPGPCRGVKQGKCYEHKAQDHNLSGIPRAPTLLKTFRFVYGLRCCFCLQLPSVSAAKIATSPR
jgi:hypothetical protein